jgi:hypothetical protein
MSDYCDQQHSFFLIWSIKPTGFFLGLIYRNRRIYTILHYTVNLIKSALSSSQRAIKSSTAYAVLLKTLICKY